jgi:hypothetical protein
MATLTLQPGVGSGFDTSLHSGSSGSDCNWGASPSGYHLGFFFNTSYMVLRYLARPDLSSIPTTATIDSATFSLYQIGTGTLATVNAYRVLREWVAGTKDGMAHDAGESAWVHAGATNWGTWGCDNTTTDREATAVASLTPAGTANIWLNWIFSATAVKEWVDGTLTNNGFILISSNEASNNLSNNPHSDYTTDTTLRPKFTVEYTVGRQFSPFPMVRNI